MSSSVQAIKPFGVLLKKWRTRRRTSQLALACDSGISSRHLSFIETGRAEPSREMVMRVAHHLDLPLRERNELLIAAGYAPVYSAKPLDDSSMVSIRRAVDLVLAGHEPFPALAIDRNWNMIAANRVVPLMLAGVSTELLTPPVNVLRLCFHPKGLASRILNAPQWFGHLAERVRHQAQATHDGNLIALLEEMAGYAPSGEDVGIVADLPNEFGGVAVPLQLSSPAGVLSFLSTTTVFGTPLNVTVAEIAIESFFPADGATAEALRQIAAG